MSDTSQLSATPADSNTTTATHAASNPNLQSSGPSQSQIAAARERWIARGLSAEDFDRAASGQPGGTATDKPKTGPSPEQIAAARERWIKRGLDPADFDAAAAGSNARQDGLEQAAKMVEKLRASGVAEDRIQDALRADGYDPADIGDDRSEADRQHDAAFGFSRERSAQEYHFTLPQHVLAQGVEHSAGVLREAQEFGAALQCEPTVAAGLVDRSLTLAKEFKALNPAQQQLYLAKQNADLHKRYGSAEAVDEMLKASLVALKVAKASAPNNPFVKAVSLAPHIARDPWIVGTLVNLGRRYGAWADGRPTKL